MPLFNLKINKNYCAKQRASELEVENVEKELEFIFPKLYKELLNEIGVGFFSTEYEKLLPTDTVFESFYLLETVVRLYKHNKENEIPSYFIPFGSDNIANLVCFFKFDEKIYFIDKEKQTPKIIADNFEQFLLLI